MANFTGDGTDNTLIGTGSADEINGLAGDDILKGGSGNDTINGGDGDDTIFGQAGDDELNGGLGDDRFLISDDNNSTNAGIDGGEGFDIVEAKWAIDDILLDLAAANVERAYGSANNDVFDASGLSSDTSGLSSDMGVLLTGRGGDDTLTGTIYADVLKGGTGNDTINGGVGNDTIFGQAGDDELNGGLGDDRFLISDGNGSKNKTAGIDGGDGRDIVEAKWASEEIVLDLAKANVEQASGSKLYGDTLDASGLSEAVTLVGRGGDDKLTGTGYDDILKGGDDDDTIHARSGDDRVFGQNGDDVIYGQAGDDRLFGGAGDDNLRGGQGKDILEGGAGNDTLRDDSGGTVDDQQIMTGGTGIDTFVLATADTGENEDDHYYISDFAFGEDKITLGAGDASSVRTFSTAEDLAELVVKQPGLVESISANENGKLVLKVDETQNDDPEFSYITFGDATKLEGFVLDTDGNNKLRNDGGGKVLVGNEGEADTFFAVKGETFPADANVNEENVIFGFEDGTDKIDLSEAVIFSKRFDDKVELVEEDGGTRVSVNGGIHKDDGTVNDTDGDGFADGEQFFVAGVTGLSEEDFVLFG
jgi:Ca2+-binding RTX toxin-like protein